MMGFSISVKNWMLTRIFQHSMNISAMSSYKNCIDGHHEHWRYHPSINPGPELEASSSLAFSSLKPRTASILWPGHSTSDQMPRSRSLVVTSPPLSPVNSKIHRWKKIKSFLHGATAICLPLFWLIVPSKVWFKKKQEIKHTPTTCFVTSAKD